jgi:hypothetical protein
MSESNDLRNALASAGVERTPAEVAAALSQARKRIGRGCCQCGDESAETRYGWCFPCFQKGGPDADALERKLKGEIDGETYITAEAPR